MPLPLQAGKQLGSTSRGEWQLQGTTDAVLDKAPPCFVAHVSFAPSKCAENPNKKGKKNKGWQRYVEGKEGGKRKTNKIRKRMLGVVVTILAPLLLVPGKVWAVSHFRPSLCTWCSELKNTIALNALKGSHRKSGTALYNAVQNTAAKYVT